MLVGDSEIAGIQQLAPLHFMPQHQNQTWKLRRIRYTRTCNVERVESAWTGKPSLAPSATASVVGYHSFQRLPREPGHYPSFWPARNADPDRA
jgi:hypothetical protein